jgi:uncharacterized phage protein gp47/JayE
MPFKRPTLKELIKQARAAFDARLPDADARLKQSILNVNAAVMAGLVNGTYGYLDYLAQNLNQQTQDEFYLVRTGQLYGLAPNPAVLSSGNANFTGIDTTPVPSGTELADSGAISTRPARMLCSASATHSLPWRRNSAALTAIWTPARRSILPALLPA